MSGDNGRYTCWVVTDGKAGTENQALGLAEALGSTVVLKRTRLKTPWRQLSPYFRSSLDHCLSLQGDQLCPPWPQLLIASGRQSILPALYVKKASQQRTSIIYVQNPVISTEYFDLVIAPQHDQLVGRNVITTQGALHRVTETRLKKAKEEFSNFKRFATPRIAVLIGGTNRTFRFDQKTSRNLVTQLQALQKKYQASLLISPSRRTDDVMIKELHEHLRGDQVYIWDMKAPNPYFALLAWADVILVTCDSVSMISEVCSTTKPVYMIPLPGGDKKFASFHHQMLTTKRVRWIGEELDFTPVEPLNETSRSAQLVQEFLKTLKQ